MLEEVYSKWKTRYFHLSEKKIRQATHFPLDNEPISFDAFI